jgi:DNA mismatch repair protein MSH3
VLLVAFNRIGNAFDLFDSLSDVGFKSGILNDIIAALPKLKEPMKALLKDIVLRKAAQGDREMMWADPEKYPEISDFEMVCPILLSATEHIDILPRPCRWLRQNLMTS